MDVAVFVRSMNAGGAQRAMLRLATGFVQAGHNVEVVTLHTGGSFHTELSPDCTVIALRPKRIIAAVPALVRYLRRRRPDALLVTEPACNISVILAKILSGTSARVLIRESMFPSTAVKEDPHRSTRIAYRLAPILYRYADVIVSIASDMTSDLARWARINPSRITTIPVNPVVTPTLQAAAKEAPDHHWFEDTDIPVVLGVGRLHRQKDFPTLLRAFERVRATRPCRLLIIGDGPMRGELDDARAASPYADDIDLAGFSPRPFPYMANCDVFVLSSRYEGQPNVLIEALASGAPVVATDCPSGPRDILDGGRYGRLCPVGDVIAMAEAISATLDAPVDRSLSKARGSDYTLEKSVALYLEALSPDVAVL
ncbi:glycosyltransferase [Mycobacterium sp. pW049]|uniref:glycosyltransferase n=1 Tax=[Mycobacterium] bulgaricum TaxID=3238985 RepID=UPI00351AB6AA